MPVTRAKARLCFFFPLKVWAPMGFFSIAFGLPVVQTDGQSFERCQSRDYQILLDG